MFPALYYINSKGMNGSRVPSESRNVRAYVIATAKQVLSRYWNIKLRTSEYLYS